MVSIQNQMFDTEKKQNMHIFLVKIFPFFQGTF